VRQRLDVNMGGGRRWVEVAPSGAATSIALIAAHDGLRAGVETGIRFVAADARRSRIDAFDVPAAAVSEPDPDRRRHRVRVDRPEGDARDTQVTDNHLGALAVPPECGG